MKYSARLIGVTKPLVHDIDGPEGLLAYCARRSSNRPKEEWGKDFDGLLRHCIKNKHWSVFGMVNALIEVEAPRDMARQQLRHYSIAPQEFSQRYSDQIKFTTREIRRQDEKNRQNSFDDFSDIEQEEFKADCQEAIVFAQRMYDKWRSRNGAKECCRVFLPEGLTMSDLAFNGSVRSWLTYLEVRDDPGVTQWEHVLIAREIEKELKKCLPVVLEMRDLM